MVLATTPVVSDSLAARKQRLILPTVTRRGGMGQRRQVLAAANLLEPRPGRQADQVPGLRAMVARIDGGALGLAPSRAPAGARDAALDGEVERGAVSAGLPA